MDIVSNSLFSFKIIEGYEVAGEFIAHENRTNQGEFTTNEEDIYKPDYPSYTLKENTVANILFEADDDNARLYLDCLDVVPDNFGVKVDLNGRYYINASATAIPLFRSNDLFDALKVDSFSIVVTSGTDRYYSVLDVIPKRMDNTEWQMMIQDLENEVRGLARELRQKSLGQLGDTGYILTPELMAKFVVLKEYGPKVHTALMQIQKNPKYQIVTKYISQDESRTTVIDDVTIRYYLARGGSENQYLTPKKEVTYDIQENRLLKRIITDYDRDLRSFIKMVEELVESKTENRLRTMFVHQFQEFIIEAGKLLRLTGAIKNADWYKSVGMLTEGTVPHSMAMDSNYSILYKMHMRLKDPQFHISMDPFYVASWKQSSLLYEMWSYIKLCRELCAKYTSDIETSLQFNETGFFPFLQEGTKVCFSNDEVVLEVIYDKRIPSESEESIAHENPFFAIGENNRPDIIIDVYAKDTDWYLGSIICECKYRSIRSINKIRKQITNYANQMNSRIMLNGEDLEVYTFKTIQHVYVLTPDIKSEKVYSELNTSVLMLRPDETRENYEFFIANLEYDISNILKRYAFIKNTRM